MCFSTLPDSISQWTRYANDATGYSIGFNLSSICPATPPSTNAMPELSLGYSPVIYEQNTQEEMLYKLLIAIDDREKDDGLKQIAIQRLFQKFTAIMKNPGFKEEHEVRLMYATYLGFDNSGAISQLFYPVQGGPFKVSSTKRRTKQLDGNIIETTHVELDLCAFDKNCCINSLKIGPKNQKSAKDVYEILISEGINIDMEKIKISAIPYR